MSLCLFALLIGNLQSRLILKPAQLMSLGIKQNSRPGQCNFEIPLLPFFLIGFAFQELSWFCLFNEVRKIKLVSLARWDCYVV